MTQTAMFAERNDREVKASGDGRPWCGVGIILFPEPERSHVF